jgi:ADP-heptose:LPS heptosyltransferase
MKTVTFLFPIFAVIGLLSLLAFKIPRVRKKISRDYRKIIRGFTFFCVFAFIGFLEKDINFLNGIPLGNLLSHLICITAAFFGANFLNRVFNKIVDRFYEKDSDRNKFARYGGEFIFAYLGLQIIKFKIQFDQVIVYYLALLIGFTIVFITKSSPGRIFRMLIPFSKNEQQKDKKAPSFDMMGFYFFSFNFLYLGLHLNSIQPQILEIHTSIIKFCIIIIFLSFLLVLSFRYLVKILYFNLTLSSKVVARERWLLIILIVLIQIYWPLNALFNGNIMEALIELDIFFFTLAVSFSIYVNVKFEFLNKVETNSIEENIEKKGQKTGNKGKSESNVKGLRAVFREFWEVLLEYIIVGREKIKKLIAIYIATDLIVILVAVLFIFIFQTYSTGPELIKLFFRSSLVFCGTLLSILVIVSVFLQNRNEKKDDVFIKVIRGFIYLLGTLIISGFVGLLISSEESLKKALIWNMPIVYKDFSHVDLIEKQFPLFVFEFSIVLLSSALIWICLVIKNAFGDKTLDISRVPNTRLIWLASLTEMRILIIQLKQIGDAILTTPVMRILRKHFPNAYMGCLIKPHSYHVVSGNPFLDKIHILDNISSAEILPEIKKENYDIVLSLSFKDSIQSIGIARFSGAKFKAGIRPNPIYNWNANDLEIKYVVEMKKKILEALGIQDNENVPPEVFVPPEAEYFAGFFVQKTGIKKTDIVISISPTSKRKFKRWGLDNFAGLADKIIETCKAKIILVWGPGEKKIVRAVAEKMKNKPVIASKTATVKELGAILKRCNLHIGNDNGTKHLAVAMNLPTITIFGPTSHLMWNPPDSQKYVYFRKLPSCFEDDGLDRCQNRRECQTLICMETITADEVYAGAKKILEKIKYKN